MNTATLLSFLKPTTLLLCCCSLQCEQEIQKLTTQLQKEEDELDSAESQLAEINLKLEEAEQQMDENERYYTMFVVSNTSQLRLNKCML